MRSFPYPSFNTPYSVKDLSLLEAMQRLLALALDKVRATGELAESVVMALLDTIMGSAIEPMQSTRLLGAHNCTFSTS